MRQQLLNDFLPDDTCPLGAPLCMETPVQINQSGLPENAAPNTVSYLNHFNFFLSISANKINVHNGFYCAG